MWPFSKSEPEVTKEERRGLLEQSARARVRATKLSEAVHSTRLLEELTADLAFTNPDAGTEFDDRLFVQLGAVSPLDLSTTRMQTAQRLCLLSYRKNPRAFRTIENVVNFALGDGIRFRANDPRVQAVLDEHWRINNWDEMAAPTLRLVGIFGELLFPVFIRDSDGMVTISSISPFNIVGMTLDKDNSEIIASVWTSLHRGDRAPLAQNDVLAMMGDGKGGLHFNLIHPDRENGLSVPEKDPALFFAVNRFRGAKRGMPDLLPSLDWLEGLDQYTYALLEKAFLANQVVHDLTYKGLNDNELKTKVDHFDRNLRSGGTYGHNDNVELKIVSPDLKAGDSEAVMRILLRHIQAGTGFAGMFFGDADDLTRASATEISIPVAKMIKARQEFFRFMLGRIFELQIQESKKRGRLNGVEDFGFQINMSKLFLRDLQPIAEALDKLSDALEKGRSNGWITNRQASQFYQSTLEQFGTEVEADTGEAEDEDGDEEVDDEEDAEDGITAPGGNGEVPAVPAGR